MTRIYINRFTGAVTASAGGGSALSSITAKHGTDWCHEICFVDNAGRVVRLDEAARGRLVVRQKDAYGFATGEPIVWAAEWTAPTTSDNAYLMKMPVYGDAVDTLDFETSGTCKLIMALAWTDENGRHESATVPFTIEPSVWAGDELQPMQPLRGAMKTFVMEDEAGVAVPMRLAGDGSTENHWRLEVL